MFNAQALNTAPLAGAAAGKFVAIPPGTTGLTCVVVERAAVTMSGTTGMVADVYGDIARRAVVPSSSFGLLSSLTGWIEVFRQVPIPAGGFELTSTVTGSVSIASIIPGGLLSISSVLSGTLFSQTAIPAGLVSAQFDFSGEIRKFVMLTGQLNANSSVTSELTKMQCMSAETGLTSNVFGTVYRIVYIGPAGIGLQFDFSATLNVLRSMSGFFDMKTELSAVLFNNAKALDTEEKTAIRPYQERTVSR